MAHLGPPLPTPKPRIIVTAPLELCSAPSEEYSTGVLTMFVGWRDVLNDKNEKIGSMQGGIDGSFWITTPAGRLWRFDAAALWYAVLAAERKYERARARRKVRHE